jgi:hypothetical protein
MPDATETTVEKRIAEYGKATRFQPGNPGRPKGSKNKLGEEFIHALYEDFKANGTGTIEIARRTDPVQYLKVIAAVIPKEVIHKVEDFSELSDSELERELIAAAREIRALREVEGGGSQKKLPAPLPH